MICVSFVDERWGLVLMKKIVRIWFCLNWTYVCSWCMNQLMVLNDDMDGVCATSRVLQLRFDFIWLFVLLIFFWYVWCYLCENGMYVQFHVCLLVRSYFVWFLNSVLNYKYVCWMGMIWYGDMNIGDCVGDFKCSMKDGITRGQKMVMMRDLWEHMMSMLWGKAWASNNLGISFCKM